MSDRPNVLLIMTDQQQWQTIAGRSLAHTPNLQRLVDGGVVFDRAYTPCALCCPARAMLLTGAYHWHNGVFNQVHSSPSVHRDMFPGVVTYPERMKQAGYRLGYVGKWHASHERGPLHFGFDHVAGLSPHYEAMLPPGTMAPEDRWANHPSREKVVEVSARRFRWPGSEPFAMWACMDGPEEATHMAFIAGCAERMLHRLVAQGGPWHLEVHFPEPHDTYRPLRSYLERYRPEDIPLPPSFYDTFEGKPSMHRRESETWGEVDEATVREGLAYYFAYCEQLDAQIGRVLDRLEALGQAENTLVVFCTDHGDMVGSHRMWIKGWMPYEECYRIPLIVRWPGHIAPGSVSPRLVQLHDIAHTLTDVLGLEPLAYADGRSLAPLFQSPAREDWEDEVLCAFYGGEFVYTQRMVITDRYKYVFNGFDYDELYDLVADPHEMHNVVDYPSYRAVAGEMRERLYRLMNRYGDPYGDDTPAYTGTGERPNRYGAPRYLARR
jgi:arylsulfatase A-like enzyme